MGLSGCHGSSGAIRWGVRVTLGRRGGHRKRRSLSVGLGHGRGRAIGRCPDGGFGWCFCGGACHGCGGGKCGGLRRGKNTGES